MRSESQPHTSTIYTLLGSVAIPLRCQLDIMKLGFIRLSRDMPVIYAM